MPMPQRACRSPIRGQFAELVLSNIQLMEIKLSSSVLIANILNSKLSLRPDIVIYFHI